MMAILRRLLQDIYLLGLLIYNHFYNFIIWLNEIWQFYRYPLLFKADIYWMMEYAFRSPFTISRQSIKQFNLDPDLAVYGETPWTTLKQIGEAINLTAEDRVYELGSGTGRSLIFISQYFGCACRGFELVPRFVEKFSWLQHKLGLGQIEILGENWFDAPLSEGNVFLLVGTCYSDAQITQTHQKLKEISEDSRIITISWPLTSPHFELLNTLELPFSWGKATVYIHKKRALNSD